MKQKRTKPARTGRSAPSARNPFIEGTIPQSVLVDITHVKNQKLFFKEFVNHFQP